VGDRFVRFSVVIPAHNESESIADTLRPLTAALEAAQIDYEVIVVDDSSEDDTAHRAADFAREQWRVRCIRSPYEPGFGLAVRAGLEAFEGDAVAIVMADGSDSPDDLVRYYGLLEEGYECAFGSRFAEGSVVHDYPRFKLVLNRIVNFGIRLLFRQRYNDTTNAFKAYRREVVDNCQPLLSKHFNLTVELPLKAITRGHTYATPAISWTNRTTGESKLRLQEMGSRYLFIVLYVFLEYHLSRGDYKRRDTPGLPLGARVGSSRGARRAGTR
jgi:dolichol-phosphate mannosyltransferase